MVVDNECADSKNEVKEGRNVFCDGFCCTWLQTRRFFTIPTFPIAVERDRVANNVIVFYLDS